MIWGVPHIFGLTPIYSIPTTGNFERWWINPVNPSSVSVDRLFIGSLAHLSVGKVSRSVPKEEAVLPGVDVDGLCCANVFSSNLEASWSFPVECWNGGCCKVTVSAVQLPSFQTINGCVAQIANSKEERRKGIAKPLEKPGAVAFGPWEHQGAKPWKKWWAIRRGSTWTNQKNVPKCCRSIVVIVPSITGTRLVIWISI